MVELLKIFAVHSGKKRKKEFGLPTLEVHQMQHDWWWVEIMGADEEEEAG